MGDLPTKIKKSEAQANIKAVEMAAVQQKMAAFTEMLNQRRRNGFDKRLFQTGEEVREAIEEYLNQILPLGIVPDVSGFCLYYGMARETFYAMAKCGDDRAAACKAYQEYLDFYTTQSGLAQSTNPAFSCFYAKAKLGWHEDNVLDINLNVGAQQQISPVDLMMLVQNTPIEADYTDVTED